jgi:hypothetical protein
MIEIDLDTNEYFGQHDPNIGALIHTDEDGLHSIGRLFCCGHVTTKLPIALKLHAGHGRHEMHDVLSLH